MPDATQNIDETLNLPLGPQPIDPKLIVSDEPSMVKNAAATPEKDIVGKFKDWATRMPAPGERSLMGEPELLRPVSQAIHSAADIILPSNTTEALIDATLGVASGAGNLAYKGFKTLGIPDLLAKWSARALPSAVGATSEALQDRSAAPGAATAVSSQAFGAALAGIFGGENSLVGKFMSKFGTANNNRLQNRIAEYLSPELADRMGKDLPTLATNLGGIDGVKELVIPKKGTREIGTILDGIESQIKAKFKRGSFNVSEDAYNIVHGRPLNDTATNGLVAVSANDIVDFRRILKDRARDLMKKEGTTNIQVSLKEAIPTTLPTPGPGGAPANTTRSIDVGQLAQDIEDTLKRGIKSDTRLTKKFTTALDDYGKTIDLREALLPEYNKIFPTYPNVKSSTFDPVAMYSAMTKHADTITQERFPELYRLFEGNSRGIGPRWEKLSFPGRFVGGGRSARLAESIPTVEYLSAPKHMRDMLFPVTTGGVGSTMRSAASSNMQTSLAQALVPTSSAFFGANSNSQQPIPNDMLNSFRK